MVMRYLTCACGQPFGSLPRVRVHVPSSFSYLLLRDLAPFWPLYVTVSGVCMRVRISEIEFGDGRMGPAVGVDLLYGRWALVYHRDPACMR